MLHVCLVGLIVGGRSGVSRYAAALIGALDEVAPEFDDLSLRLLTTPIGADRANVDTIPVELAGGPFSRSAEGPGRVLAEQLNCARTGGGLLHFFDLVGPVLAPRRRFVTTIHDAAMMHGFERARMAHKRALAPWAARRASATVAVSAFSRDEAVRLLGADPARTEVIHSGPGLVPGRSMDGGECDPPYALYVGNLAPHKNLPFLIEAFGRVEAELRLILAGSGGHARAVREVIASSPAAGRIEIREGLPDAEIEHLYRGAAMVLLPSLYEGFGFTALEAMARDRPVIAADIPAVREVSGDGAVLVPPDDAAGWARAIERVLSDRALREDLRRRGRETVARYSWLATARALCELFRRVGPGPA